MIVQKLPIYCQACQKKFQGDVVTDAPVKVFVVSVREMRCPHCGAGYKKLAFVTGEKTA